MAGLGTLGGNQSNGLGISDDGSTIVGYSRNTDGYFEAYRRTEASAAERNNHNDFNLKQHQRQGSFCRPCLSIHLCCLNPDECAKPKANTE